MKNDNKNTANLIITCPDRPGIIKDISAFLFEYWANISFLEEHTEEGQFFMRVEWELENFSLKSKKDFLKAFGPIKEKFLMEIILDFKNTRKKVGLFCSREWHCLIDILTKTFLGELDIEISYVISNSLDLEEIVKKFWVPFYYIPTKKDSFEHEKEQLTIIRKYKTDFIGLARYMKILSQDFIESIWQKIINIHHSFLPSFIWARPYNDAYARGVKLIGATAHYVIPELDQWPIIDQQVKRVKHCHDVWKLKQIGKVCEKEVFANAIQKQRENKIIVYKNRSIIFE